VSEFITHAEWVKLVSKTLDAMLQYQVVVWDDRMKIQKVAMGSVVVLTPDETVPPLQDL
jgi:transcription elongation GreA/GreB family factor